MRREGERGGEGKRGDFRTMRPGLSASSAIPCCVALYYQAVLLWRSGPGSGIQ